MNHASLFSGIGGAELAAEWMGWKNIFHCEINEFGTKILKYYWPNAKTYTDIKTTDFSVHRGQIDVLTGGFPCQPYSTAGKRLGKQDNRHLWPDMLRSIREIQPAWVVGENVLGLTNWQRGLVFEEVQTDLENEGYEVVPLILPACGVNAPHRRDRVWFVAYRADARIENMQQTRENRIHETCTTTNTNGNGYELRGFGQDRSAQGEGTGEQKKRQRIRGNHRRIGKPWIASYTIGLRLRRKNNRIGKPRQFNKTSSRNDWENFPTQSPICSGNDGISSRLDGITFYKWRRESIKAYGNAIVPQVIYEIFKGIEATN